MAGKCSTFMYLFLCTTLVHWGIGVSKPKYGALKLEILRFSSNFNSVNFQYFLILKLALLPGFKWGGRASFRIKKYWKLTELKFAEVLRRPRRVLTGKRRKESGADVIWDVNTTKILKKSWLAKQIKIDDFCQIHYMDLYSACSEWILCPETYGSGFCRCKT
jgi:hypothetical protein